LQTKWWHDAVVYQIYPRSFNDANGDGIGDLAGIIGRLDYLQWLGVDVIWLSPVFRSPMDDNGYDISDYCDIAPEFGTLAEMDRLIAEAARRGIRIVMDLVVNHTSDEHPWFVAARQSKDSPYRDYYIWRAPRADGTPPDDQRASFGGSAWEFDAATGEYYYHLFSRRQPDLNWANPKVRDAVYRVMNWWLERGIGGFRMDVIDLIVKDVDRGITTNGPTLHAYLQEMNAATFGTRDVLTVGETWSATPEIAKLYSDPQRGELSMVFQFEHVTITHDPREGKWKPRPFDLIAFKRVIDKWQRELADVGWNSLFWSNHDLPRAVSKYGDDGRYRVESAKMLATALHLLKGTPYVYQGEEIGMTNARFAAIDDYRDIESLGLYRERTAAGVPHAAMMEGIYANGRDNARTPMQWSAAANAGFTAGEPWIGVNPNHVQINVAAAQADPDSVLHHYRALIGLRKRRDVIVYGDYQPLFAAHPQVFAYRRSLGAERLVVINNFSAASVALDLPAGLAGLSGECLICNYAPRHALGERLVLQPYESFAVATRAPAV
jgi:oligo-1,6-glucosidase